MQREAPLYQHRSGPVVSFCFLDRLRHHAEADPESNLLTALQSAYKDIYDASLKPEKAEEIANQLPKPNPPSAKSQADKPDFSKGLGSDLMQWLGKQAPDRLCYLLSDFNPAVAATLYHNTDYRVVQDMAEVYLQNRWHSVQAQFEGAMYGFGGGYKDSAGSPVSDNDENCTVYDLTDPKSRGAALKALRALNWTE